MPRPPSLAQFLAVQPPAVAAYLRPRLVEVPGGHWIWRGSISQRSTGGGKGRPKCGVTLQTPAGPVRFTLVYRLTLYLAYGPALPGFDEALHACRYNNRHVGFCCRPVPGCVQYGPSTQNWYDRKAALLAAGRVPRIGRKPAQAA